MTEHHNWLRNRQSPRGLRFVLPENCSYLTRPLLPLFARKFPLRFGLSDCGVFLLEVDFPSSCLLAGQLLPAVVISDCFNCFLRSLSLKSSTFKPTTPLSRWLSRSGVPLWHLFLLLSTVLPVAWGRFSISVLVPTSVLSIGLKWAVLAIPSWSSKPSPLVPLWIGAGSVACLKPVARATAWGIWRC